MSLFTDQLGRVISISKKPQRIISLVPSQTELLFDLGLSNEVVGITKFCIHPAEWFRTKSRIGGTKNIHLEKIDELKPDLIIANKEENTKEQIEILAKQYSVWVSDVNTLEDAMVMICEIGCITSASDKAEKIMKGIEKGFTELKYEISKKQDTRTKDQVPINENKKNTNKKTPTIINEQLTPCSRLPTPTSRLAAPISTCYLIWKDPYMIAGGDTFISNMLQYCGLTNAFGHLTRYPEITIPQLQTINPQLILLSSEPYPFKQKHIDDLQQQLPHSKIILVDGEFFSWYGSRLLKAPDYFNELIKLINDKW
ncbi:MAG: ABC transporter substrate-binding protein [Chitinophagaceae bacterium]